MANILLLCGSVFGTATLTADEIEATLDEAGHEVTRPEPQTIDVLLDESIEWLIVCTSSTGNGDVPDDLNPVYMSLLSEYPKITHLKYTVVALGDSSYETFCGGGLAIDAALADLGATQMAPAMKIDALEVTEPEEIAPDWVLSVIDGTHEDQADS